MRTAAGRSWRRRAIALTTLLVACGAPRWAAPDQRATCFDDGTRIALRYRPGNTAVSSSLVAEQLRTFGSRSCSVRVLVYESEHEENLPGGSRALVEERASNVTSALVANDVPRAAIEVRLLGRRAGRPTVEIQEVEWRRPRLHANGGGCASCFPLQGIQH